jgi:hypothetical protein
MDTEAVDVHLSKAVSLLGVSDERELPLQEVIDELHICERELVAGRFVRRNNSAGGRAVVRVPGVDSALIHIGRAMSLIDKGGSAEEALHDLKEAREHVAQISA